MACGAASSSNTDMALQAQLREPNASAVGQAPINTKGNIIADVQFEVIYLGEAAAVLRGVPADDEDDQEAAQQPLFVLQKAGTETLQIVVRGQPKLHSCVCRALTRRIGSGCARFA